MFIGYPQKITWEFGDVSEDADHLRRLRLYLETDAIGEMDINLDGVELITY